MSSDAVHKAIQVFGRIKRSDCPLIGDYDVRNTKDFNQELLLNFDHNADFMIDKNKIPKQRFRFAKIFDQDTTQNEIFENVAKPVVNNVLTGYNGTIFAYGQTGSGKTYSMTGSTDYESRGIIPRTIKYIFKQISKSTDMIYNIYISYLEIYNEQAYDLLNPKHRATSLEELPRVMLLEDGKGQIHLKNLGVISVCSEKEAMCLLFLGDTNRTIAETPMNLYSSRSHCIFTIHVACTFTNDSRVRRSKLHLVDLAGSERIQKSAINGSLLSDAKQINLSLHYLERVIVALSDSKKCHVPYRNSLMTSVLRDSLGGNCLTVMLATLSLEFRNFEETISTCKFAQRVAMITSEAIINEEEDPYTRITDLKLEIETLKNQISSLRSTTTRNSAESSTELSIDDVKNCEKEVLLYINGTNDEISINGNVNKATTCFEIFKKIITSQQAVSSMQSSDTSQYRENIKKKDAQTLPLINSKTQNCANTNYNYDNEINSNNKQLSEKEAFELFLNQGYGDNDIIKCGNALKQKMQNAKKCADEIQMCKDNIIKLKNKLRDSMNISPELIGQYMAQLKMQQEIYRENILQLYNLKKEAMHLSHGFHQAKRRVTQQFIYWWENYKNSFNPSDRNNKCFGSTDKYNLKNISDFFNWHPDFSCLNSQYSEMLLNSPTPSSIFDVKYDGKFPDDFTDSGFLDNFRNNRPNVNHIKGESPPLYKQSNINSPSEYDFYLQRRRPNYHLPPPCMGMEYYTEPNVPQLPNNFVNRIPPMHRQDINNSMNRTYCQRSTDDLKTNLNFKQQGDQRPMNIDFARNETQLFNTAYFYKFNNFNPACQTNYMNSDIPEKLPNIEKPQELFARDYQQMCNQNRMMPTSPLTSPRTEVTSNRYYNHSEYYTNPNNRILESYKPKNKTNNNNTSSNNNNGNNNNNNNNSNNINHNTNEKNAQINQKQFSCNVKKSISDQSFYRNSQPYRTQSRDQIDSIEKLYESENKKNGTMFPKIINSQSRPRTTHKDLGSNNNNSNNSSFKSQIHELFMCPKTKLYDAQSVSLGNDSVTFRSRNNVENGSILDEIIEQDLETDDVQSNHYSNTSGSQNNPNLSSRTSSETNITTNLPLDDDLENTDVIDEKNTTSTYKFNTKFEFCSTESTAYDNPPIVHNFFPKSNDTVNENENLVDLMEKETHEILNNSLCTTNRTMSNDDEDLNTSHAQEIMNDKVNIDEEFIKSIPLTGDPEVDEEILSFYRSKQIILKHTN